MTKRQNRILNFVHFSRLAYYAFYSMWDMEIKVDKNKSEIKQDNESKIYNENDLKNTINKMQHKM